MCDCNDDSDEADDFVPSPAGKIWDDVGTDLMSRWGPHMRQVHESDGGRTLVIAWSGEVPREVQRLLSAHEPGRVELRVTSAVDQTGLAARVLENRVEQLGIVFDPPVVGPDSGVEVVLQDEDAAHLPEVRRLAEQVRLRTVLPSR